MDDGSHSPEISAKMLDAETQQGVASVVLTPHFYALKESPDDFLKRREIAINRLRQVYLPGYHPVLYAGAEVAYYRGISKSEAIEKLMIRGTRTILIEMPFTDWAEPVINEIYELRDNRGMIPVIAHYERYPQSRKTAEGLLARGIIFQTNAEYVLEKRGGRKALKYIDKGIFSLLGSDSHNLSDRAVNMRAGMKKIEAALGPDALYNLEANAELLLSKAEPLFP